MRSPVSGVTGLWALLLGWFFFVGLIVWFVKVNGALNAYWRSQGARLIELERQPFPTIHVGQTTAGRALSA